MIVRIESFDGVKGKGTYSCPDGSREPFSYNQFCGGVLIPPGTRAWLDCNRLHKYVTPWQYFIWWLKEVVRWL